MHAKDLTEESTAHYVGLHGNKGVFHRETSLTALSMSLLMIETTLVLVGCLGVLSSKLVSDSCTKVATLVTD